MSLYVRLGQNPWTKGCFSISSRFDMWLLTRTFHKMGWEPQKYSRIYQSSFARRTGSHFDWQLTAEDHRYRGALSYCKIRNMKESIRKFRLHCWWNREHRIQVENWMGSLFFTATIDWLLFETKITFRYFGVCVFFSLVINVFFFGWKWTINPLTHITYLQNMNSLTSTKVTRIDKYVS